MNTTKKAGLALVAAVMAVVMLLVVWLVQVDSDSQPVGQTGSSSAKLKPGTVPPQYEAAISAAGSMCPEVPAPFIAAQLEQESGFNPKAVSPAGAQGIAQFMPGTAAAYGLTDPFDPIASIAAQGRYDCTIAKNMKPKIASGAVKGDVLDIISWSYNAGEGAVIQYGGEPPYAETIAYAKSIKSKMAKYTQPGSTFGPGVGKGGKYTYRPGVDEGQQAVAALMQYLGITYAWGGGDFNGPTKGIHDGGVADEHGDYNKVGFDCSGATQYAIFQGTNGRVRLGRNTHAQSGDGRAVSMSELKAGDLILMNGDEHVGLARGDGTMIEAPQSGDVLKVSPVRGGHGVRVL